MSIDEEKRKGISRRGFLKTAAAASATGVLGSVLALETGTAQAAAAPDAAAASVAVEDPRLLRVELGNDCARRVGQGNVKLEKLLQPGKIGSVQTRNRMIKTAAYGWILWDTDKAKFRAEGLAYYEAIARGGVGLMVMEDPAFRPDTIGRPFYSDESIAVERQLVDVIHKQGCPTFAQFTDFRPLMGIAAASEFCYPSKLDMNNAMPKALTVDEIHDNTKLIADAAERCKKAGYDGIEINCGCSHMFATFISRFWNKRTDEYGPQNFENRARIVTDMIQAVKQRCGSDFAVGILMNGAEVNLFELGNNADCTTVEESVELAKLYEQAGADSIQVRSHSIGNHINGFFPDYYYMFGEGANNGFGMPMDMKQYWPQFVTQYEGAGAFIETAALIKKALSIPVISVGSMDPRLNPEMVEAALEAGKIDFVAMTRPLTADPDLPKKLAAGAIDDIRPCTYCITCFPMTRCRVNAASTRAKGPDMPEGYDVAPAPTKKKVMVVGGGPAGMEAARVAALRGHAVTLYEKSARLGGLMPVAAIVKGQHEKVLDFANYLSTQMNRLGVKVRTGSEVTAALIEQEKPDAVVVAVGGVNAVPDIPGIHHAKVVSSESLHQMLELGLKVIDPFLLRTLTNFFMPLGKKVVIIGGQIQGVQLAEFLSQRGRDVTIVDQDPAEKLGLNMPDYVKERVLLFNQSHGVKTLMGVTYHEINDQGIELTTAYGIRKTIEADSIIIAVPTNPNTALVDSLKGKVNEVYTVGDCQKAGVIVDAIESANLTARKI
jgi:2,4-dienoyl-CoA reductase (NADPH2)